MLDALTHDQLRVFVTIADLGSFRAAAGRLQRAQSAISHAVASLEAQLELSLFDRSGYRPVLTERGKALLADARLVLSRTEALKAHARTLRTGVEASVELALDGFVDPLPVAGALAQFQATHPDVLVRTHTSVLGGPLLMVRDGICGLGITVSEEVRDQTVGLEAIGNLTMLAVAAPSHALAAARKDIDASEHVNIVVADPTDFTGDVIYGGSGANAWRVDDLATKRSLLLAGVGWGSMPVHILEDDLAAGRLVRVAPVGIGPGGETQVPIFLARRKHVTLGPATCALADLLSTRHVSTA